MLVIFDIFMLELRKFYLAIFTNDILKKFTGGLIIGLDLVSHCRIDCRIKFPFLFLTALAADKRV